MYITSTTADILYNDTASTTMAIVNNSRDLIFLAIGTVLAIFMVFAIVRAIFGAFRRM